jgi:hypothetical protein
MQRIFQKIKNITITVSISNSLLLFVIDNRQYFGLNSDIHNINTRNNLDFHYPQALKGFLYKIVVNLHLHWEVLNLYLDWVTVNLT